MERGQLSVGVRRASGLCPVGTWPRDALRRMGLLVVLKLLLQALACEEDTALHGAEREVHFLRNLVVLVSGHMH